MRANRLQMGPTFRDKVIERVKSFNRKHKRLKFIGLTYAVVALSGYNVFQHMYHNVKRYTCLASVLFFFVASSSFTYPEALTLNISFVSDFDTNDSEETYYTADALAEATPTSDAQLAEMVEVDKSLIGGEDEVSEDQQMAEGFYSIEDIYDAEADSTVEEISESEISDSEALSESDEASELSGFSRDDWNLILVNKQHPIPEDYDFPMGTINSTMCCDERVLSPLKSMLRAAAADGINLAICSPYRSSERQEGLFARKIDYYMEAGLSYMEAYNMSSQAVTVPGSSEHQIGLAFDIVCGNYSNLDEGFGDTAAGKWLADNSYKYGFVVRYLKGKENITGIEYEPWHFRYVGIEAATIMYDNNICLEEFWDNYLYE